MERLDSCSPVGAGADEWIGIIRRSSPLPAAMTALGTTICHLYGGTPLESLRLRDEKRVHIYYYSHARLCPLLSTLLNEEGQTKASLYSIHLGQPRTSTRYTSAGFPLVLAACLLACLYTPSSRSSGPRRYEVARKDRTNGSVCKVLIAPSRSVAQEAVLRHDHHMAGGTVVQQLERRGDFLGDMTSLGMVRLHSTVCATCDRHGLIQSTSESFASLFPWGPPCLPLLTSHPELRIFQRRSQCYGYHFYPWPAPTRGQNQNRLGMSRCLGTPWMATKSPTQQLEISPA